MQPPDSSPNAGPGSRSQIDDKALVRAIVDRQQDAVAELYDRFSGMLMALAYRVLGNTQDAEEILQETFLQVWNQAARYDPKRSSVSTWLVLITRSRAIDRLRSRQVQTRTVTAARQERPDSHTSPTGVGNVLLLERRQRLGDEMARLPPEQRQVLELAFYGGSTQSEISEQTGIPLGTVKTRTLLAMKKLRAALQEEIGDFL
jgi:RNA polymerase sigma-70 factor (ECF subfamily)